MRKLFITGAIPFLLGTLAGAGLLSTLQPQPAAAQGAGWVIVELLRDGTDGTETAYPGAEPFAALYDAQGQLHYFWRVPR